MWEEGYYRDLVGTRWGCFRELLGLFYSNLHMLEPDRSVRGGYRERRKSEGRTVVTASLQWKGGKLLKQAELTAWEKGMEARTGE